MEADYVVVGAGPAGSVVAAALAAPGRTVVLIEAGERREHPFARLPAAALVAPPRRAGSRTIRSEPDPTAAGRTLEWATPRGISGSRALDALVYDPGFASDYDEWAELGATGWSYADVAPAFARLEQGGGDVLPSALALESADATAEPTRAFLAACAQLGMPTLAPGDLSERRSAHATRLTLAGGRRMSAADLWLRPRLRDRHLTLLTRTRVLSLQLDGRRCIGVFARRDGQDLQIRARAEVVLAAGVFGSPKLLMVSGIGPPGLLASVGIAPRHALAGVGGNLSDHVGVSVGARARTPVLCRRDRRLPLALAHYLNWRLTGRGVFGEPAVTASAWVALGHAALPALALDLTPAALIAGAAGPTLAAEPGLTISVRARRPGSRGRLRLGGAGVDDRLRVEHLMLSDPKEVEALSAGLEVARRLCMTAPLDALVTGEVGTGLVAGSGATVADVIRANARPLGHASGTCRMGRPDDPDAVVDARLKVHGMQGLRVVDAAAMPRAPSASPGAAAIMVATRAAEFIIEGQ